jgi:hypothetical protein
VISFRKYHKRNSVEVKQYISEAKGMLDISILNAQKYLISDKRKEFFLTTPVEIRAKLDGVKITVMKVNNTGRAEEDYIIAYKNNIIYSDEFQYLNKSDIRKNSIGNSQFQFVWDHFIKLRKNSIPVGTELFIEYLMNKPTLSSDYKYKHKLVLIGYTKSSYKVKNGRLITKPGPLETDKRDLYAKELKIDVPALLFKGILGNPKDFAKGIVSKDLRTIYRNKEINWDDKDATIQAITEMILEVPSVYGGKEEGAVFKFNNGVILKVQQPYQVDQAARAKIKDQFRGDKQYEDEYYKKVNQAVDELQKGINKSDFHKALKDFAKKLKSYKVPFSHIKKNETQIKDDIQLTFRMRLSKDVADGGLFLGKFRVLTNAHYKIIKEGIQNHDTFTVFIVSSKETKGTKALRNKMIEACFGGQIEILNGSTGNLYTIFSRSQNEITTVYAGSDRAESYEKMLEKNYGVEVAEVKRTDSDISATKVIANINDYEYFKANTPKCIWPLYEEIKETYA